MTGGRLRSIQVSLPQDEQSGQASDPVQRIWRTGMFKRPLSKPIWLGRHNLQGDGQADLIHHGGIDKAVCAYPSEHWSHWETILSPDQLGGGAFGENFTLDGLMEADVCIGDVFAVGSAVVQISQPRQPCWKLARRWQVKDLALQVERTGFTGWYFRVLQEGTVEANAPIHLVHRPCPEWTVAAANRIMHHEPDNRAASERLSLCPFLSSSWQQTMQQRALAQPGPNQQERQLEQNSS